MAEPQAPAARYVRFQATTPNARGLYPGVFGLVNRLAREGRLTPGQDEFRRVNNAWYDAAYLTPTTVDPTVYDLDLHPGAVAWFKSSAQHLISRVDGYLTVLAAHGVGCERVTTDDPGVIVYEDDEQVIAKPRP
ncbi:hypothetical protein ABZ816_11955 [Actinosynnema sp. NPDC047251]|uniref:Uncharacterized protein n=1 Tax=Saccharothrix espanaensis (strain ATCC 51144 / DSM 44229 / JCM 9112 / NBRC 15066 / NRRL 15764) TaxID=1179773 RepID=K0KAI2_SACES|nr:hypothetical protein [Saccharothrix espanaensis]CCH35311.1 hypothetical protein BN6_80940 [Saccharothrix espanaensis DSM 44229]